MILANKTVLNWIPIFWTDLTIISDPMIPAFTRTVITKFILSTLPTRSPTPIISAFTSVTPGHTIAGFLAPREVRFATALAVPGLVSLVATAVDPVCYAFFADRFFIRSTLFASAVFATRRNPNRENNTVQRNY